MPMESYLIHVYIIKADIGLYSETATWKIALYHLKERLESHKNDAVNKFQIGFMNN